jgi:hypothetical protein
VFVFERFCVKVSIKVMHVIAVTIKDKKYTSQQDFGPRKVYCVSNVTFHAESKYAMKIFPSPTVFL